MLRVEERTHEGIGVDKPFHDDVDLSLANKRDTGRGRRSVALRLHDAIRRVADPGQSCKVADGFRLANKGRFDKTEVDCLAQRFEQYPLRRVHDGNPNRLHELAPIDELLELVRVPHERHASTFAS